MLDLAGGLYDVVGRVEHGGEDDPAEDAAVHHVDVVHEGARLVVEEGVLQAAQPEELVDQLRHELLVDRGHKDLLHALRRGERRGRFASFTKEGKRCSTT